ncbi:MAG TPA: DUF6152 family protein [Cytophagales bacterium]|nr:DUF6152 family protein [Cytophagales bacterium]
MESLKIVFKKPFSWIIFSLLLLITSGFSFHHGWSSYDEKKVLNVTGEILNSSYENPHGSIKLKAEDKTWNVILAPPSRMENRGLTMEMLKVGETATVVGYPHKEVAGEMRAERITISKKTTELR